jgi:hypothetical protein
METVGHWWNGTWGRLGRRDVFLRTGQVWQVELCEGGADGRTKVWTFDSEAKARELVERALAAEGTDWRSLSG